MIGRRSSSTSGRSQPVTLESPAPSLPVRSSALPFAGVWVRDHRADLAAVLGLLFLTAIVSWQRLWFWNGLAYLDVATFYLPWYAHLGEALRSFDIPGWNPYQFSGTPFAGDPQSGWMYLPAMVIFTILDPVFAYEWFLIFHIALAALSTYAYARIMGMRPLSSSVAGVAFAFGPLVNHISCCLIHIQLAVWIPPALIGIEIASRSADRLRRLLGLSLAGFAVSQMLAGWIGQGAYNGLLVVGSYVLFRTIVSPLRPLPFKTGMREAAVSGVTILLIGFGLAAAGLLPRLDAIRGTNVAGGDYTGTGSENYANGWTFRQLFDRWFLDHDNYNSALFYVGGATIALMLIVIVFDPRRYAVPYFVGLTVVTSILSLEHVTPVHHLFYLLPRFEVLHEHVPTRMNAAQWIGPAILAGAAVEAVHRGASVLRHRLAAGLLLLVWLFVFIQSRDNLSIEWASMVVVAGILVGLIVLSRSRFVGRQDLRTMAAVALLVAVIWEPTGRTFVRAVWLGASDQVLAVPVGPVERDAVPINASSTDEGGAGEFLQQQQANGEHFRYFGYDPYYFFGGWSWFWAYREYYSDPVVQGLLVNARAMRLGLYDVQGYDPVQLATYVETLNTANHGTQNYHDAQIWQNGSDSPILNMLNVRYIVIPNQLPPGRPRPDIAQLLATHNEVFRNDKIRVLENANVLPRAWVVHRAIPASNESAYWLIDSGAVDPSTRVFLPVETNAPEMSDAPAGSTEPVQILHFEADNVRMRAELAAPGMVVISEVYAPGWNAYVDGKRTPVYLANGVLRAVSVPEGAHTIELRYEPVSLRLGLGLSIASLFAMGGLAGYFALKDRKRTLGNRLAD